MSTLYAALIGLPRLEPEEAERSAVARLPRLERLLARADAGTVTPDWRRWLLEVAGLGAPPGDLPLGRLLAAAHGVVVAPTDTWMVATPVALRAGQSSVQLAGERRLAPAVAAALATRFNADWHGTAWKLCAFAGELALRHDGALDFSSTDPATLTGGDIGGALPAGDAGPALRRLMTELQMWLHTQRLADGVNGLWLWSGGRGALTGRARWPALPSPEPLLAAARRCHPGEALADAAIARWDVGEALGGGVSLAALDAPWSAALGQGEHRASFLHASGRLFRIAPLQRLRFWRRSPPWWIQCP